MKRFSQSVLGVTLLEIMLVLAIAAMIIVMSIRYYQTASTAQQANAGFGQVQAVMAAVDNLGMNGGYATNATQANVEAVVGANNMVTSTGGAITMAQPTTATTYTLTAQFNTSICPLVASKLNNTTPRITAKCDGKALLTVTYNSTL